MSWVKFLIGSMIFLLTNPVLASSIGIGESSEVTSVEVQLRPVKNKKRTINTVKVEKIEPTISEGLDYNEGENFDEESLIEMPIPSVALDLSNKN